MTKRILIGFILFWLTNLTFADEIRPGYLELKESSENKFSVVWKVPAKGDKKLNLDVQLPDNCDYKTQPNSQLINGAYIERWVVVCDGGLVEKSISIPGLQFTNTDVLLRMEFVNDTSQSAHLSSKNYTYKIPAKASSLQIIKTYAWFGVEHILLGVDHLLFVFALLLIVTSKRLLLWTITAFTIAHSITLAGATLGLIHVAQEPVEAIIALSILFLAMEIINVQRGRFSLAAKWPWLVAFIFGLLHGFGFAGALIEVGLPQHAISLALIFFNLGVELGQLIFITIVFTLGWALHAFKQTKLMAWAKTATVYSIGGLSSFWLFERIGAF